MPAIRALSELPLIYGLPLLTPMMKVSSPFSEMSSHILVSKSSEAPSPPILSRRSDTGSGFIPVHETNNMLMRKGRVCFIMRISLDKYNELFWKMRHMHV